jgi:2-desacetyl-2-hydroxyethyl bacteriochlorophyllide A dehydrogenase
MPAAEAIICDENQRISLQQVTLPELRAKDILVRNICSGISNGTELMLIRHEVLWGQYPIWLGYQAVGIIERVGNGVENFTVGDKVYHRGSSVGAKMGGKQVSPTSGAHGTYSIVDTTSKTHSAAIMPAGLDEEQASLFVLPAVGLNGVNLSGVKTGDVVAVLGAGLVGLGNIGAAKLRGATVIAIDKNPERLNIARKIGADFIIDSSREDASKRILEIAHAGADVVFEATGKEACIDIAMSFCRMYGKFVFQGDYGQKPLTFTFYLAHEKLLSAYFPSEDGFGPCRAAVMDLMARGALKWDETITHRLKPDEAAKFYENLKNGNVKETLGAVIKW